MPNSNGATRAISIEDEIRNVISSAYIREQDSDEQGEPSLPFMIGGFIVIAEATDPESGSQLMLWFGDGLSIWSEVGILRLRLARLEHPAQPVPRDEDEDE